MNNTSDVKPIQKSRYTDGDNRFDISEAPPSASLQSRSVACLIRKEHLRKDGDKYYLQNLRTLSETLQLTHQASIDPHLPFKDQPSIALGTAFLLSERELASAGHCFCESGTKRLLDGKKIKKVRVVFDFDSRACSSSSGDIEVKVYKIEVGNSVFRLDGNNDWALLSLKSKIEDRSPLKIHEDQDIEVGQRVYMLGYPSGLPQKYTSNGIVRILKNHCFDVEIDAFTGNSGSPIFDEITGKIIGMLLGGHKDYSISSNGCLESHRVRPQEIEALGYENCLRITGEFLQVIKRANSGIVPPPFPTDPTTPPSAMEAGSGGRNDPPPFPTGPTGGRSIHSTLLDLSDFPPLRDGANSGIDLPSSPTEPTTGIVPPSAMDGSRETIENNENWSWENIWMNHKGKIFLGGLGLASALAFFYWRTRGVEPIIEPILHPVPFGDLSYDLRSGGGPGPFNLYTGEPIKPFIFPPPPSLSDIPIPTITSEVSESAAQILGNTFIENNDVISESIMAQDSTVIDSVIGAGAAVVGCTAPKKLSLAKFSRQIWRSLNERNRDRLLELLEQFIRERLEPMIGRQDEWESLVRDLMRIVKRYCHKLRAGRMLSVENISRILNHPCFTLL